MKNAMAITFGIGSLLAFAFAACGGDETGTTTSPTTSSSDAATTGSGTGGGTGGGGTGGGGGAGGGASASIEVKSHLTMDGFVVNSHLIMGTKDAILVDGQFFKAEAEAVVDMITASGKNLTTVFITHDHPDHYLGLDIIQAAFPTAQFVATQLVVDHYNATKDATFMGLKMSFGDAIADKLVDLKPVGGKSLDLEGTALEIIEIPNEGESVEAAGLGIPAAALGGKKALVSGDLIYKKAHLWTAECKLDGWKQNLDFIASMGFEVYYPGHGVMAGPEVINEDKTYLDDAKAILTAAASVDEAKMQLKTKYPDFTGDGLLDFATQTYFANCK